MSLAAAASVAIVLACTPTGAQTVLFSQDFDAENGGVPTTNFTSLSNLVVTSGSVDLIGNGFADFFPGNGLYLDMDGTSGGGGTIESQASFTLTPGRYLLQFDLGNTDDQFGGVENENVLEVSLGAAYTETFRRNGLTPFETISRPIDITTTTVAPLRLAQGGGDNLGVLIDNLSLTLIPEPTAVGLLGVSLLAAGGWRRKWTFMARTRDRSNCRAKRFTSHLAACRGTSGGSLRSPV